VLICYVNIYVGLILFDINWFVFRVSLLSIHWMRLLLRFTFMFVIMSYDVSWLHVYTG